MKQKAGYVLETQRWEKQFDTVLLRFDILAIPNVTYSYYSYKYLLNTTLLKSYFFFFAQKTKTFIPSGVASVLIVADRARHKKGVYNPGRMLYTLYLIELIQ